MAYFHYNIGRELLRNYEKFLVVFLGYNELVASEINSFFSEYADKNNIPKNIIFILSKKQMETIINGWLDVGQFSFVNRIEHASIFAITFGENGFELYKKNENFFNKVKDCYSLSFENFLEFGNNIIAEKNDPLIKSDERFHFCNPSGRHTNFFLRASNLLVENFEVEFLSLSFLNIVKGCNYLLIDSSTILSLAMAICKGLSFYALKVPKIINFHSYLLKGITSSHDSFAIISATSSGNLQKELANININKSKVLLTKNEKKSKIDSIIDLNNISYHASFKIKSYEDSKTCEYCKNKSMPIKIEGEQFLAKNSEAHEIAIRRKDLDEGTGTFINNFLDNDYLSVSEHTIYDSHKEILFNIQNLKKNKTFKKDLNLFFKTVLPHNVQVIVHLNDLDSKYLAMKISKLYKEKVKIISHKKLEGCRSDLIKKSLGIVIIGFCFQSGKNFEQISRSLRTLSPNSHKYYFSLVNLVKSKQQKEKIINTLTYNRPYKYLFNSLYNIIIDDSNDINSFQKELEILEKFTDKLSLPSYLEGIENIETLLSTREEEINSKELFLKSTNNRRLNLSKGFVFWNKPYSTTQSNQANVFFTILSVLQNKRLGSPEVKEHLLNDFYYHSVLSPDCFVQFSDGAIQASILRAARNVELDYSSSPCLSERMKCILDDFFKHHDSEQGDATPEFLLALATQKLKLTKSDLKYILDKHKFDTVNLPPFVRAIRRYIEHEICKMN